MTASVPVPEGRPLIFGGRWRRDGEFPLGHLARAGIDGDYAAILNLSGLPDNEWQAVVSGVEPLSKAGEFSFWIRPRAGKGEGNLWFDDLFGFVLPE